MKALGLDIGTTSISAVLYSQETGVQQAVTLDTGGFLPGESWERLQDPGAIREKAEALVRELLEQAPDVQAIGVTGQMHGILYLDRQSRPVSPLFTWQDGRGDLPFAPGVSWADRLSALTGYPLSTGYGLVTHFYNLRHGLVPETAARLCTIGDYIAMSLAGQSLPRMEPTNAASLGLLDPDSLAFDPAALERGEIPGTLLPPVSREAFLGIGALGKPVFQAIGDNQAAFLGAAGSRRDHLLVNVGTGSQICVYSPVYLMVPGLETRPFPDGGWLLVGASLCGGRSYALLEGFFRQTVEMVTGSSQSAYAAMDRALTRAGVLENCPVAQTTFQGTRQNPRLRGSFSGIGPDNFTPVHMIQSVMEGMARELYEMYRGYLDIGGQPPKAMIGSGNGLRKNAHLCRVFETVFGCPLTLSPCREEAACGAAIYAACHEAARS